MGRFSVPEERIAYLRKVRGERLAQLKEEAKQLTIKPLPKGQSYKALAISVDAGEVPIDADVFEGVILRCADSEGVEYFHDVVLTDGDREDVERLIDNLFQDTPVLQRLLKVMGAERWRDFAPTFVDYDPADFLREMLEWGTIVTLAEKAYKTIFLKDGLLRTKLIKPPQKDETSSIPSYLDNLRNFFEANCYNKGNFLVGVAKDSKPLQQAYKLLALKEEFLSNRSFYVKLPNFILKRAWKWTRFREGDVPWGDIYLVRLFPHAHARILTLEVPKFLEEDLDSVLRVLAALPIRLLPDRFFGFPDPLVRAHEHATLKLNIGSAIAKEVMK
jgi:hypothetical protein